MLPFTYARPDSLARAVDLLTASPDARVLAGGTDLTVGLRDGRVRPGLVVDIKRIPELAPAVVVDDQQVRVTAATPMTDLLARPEVRRRLPALAAAADVVGSIQIRHRATLAGNICNASPAADTVPVLAMYGASVTVHGPKGDREVLVADFVQGNRRIDLQPGELVTAVTVPLPGGPSGAAFERMTRRRGVDLATINVGCLVEADATTVVLGAVAPVPIVVRDASGDLGPSAGDDATVAALEAVVARATPISDVRASADYRRAMVRVLVRRALHRARTNYTETMESTHE